MTWPSPLDEYLANKSSVDGAIQRVLNSGQYILGPEVDSFEREFAQYTGADAAVGVASGTDAISLALMAVGVKPGQPVITVSHTAVATVAAIEAVGAVPVLADVDAQSMTMSPQSLRRLLSLSPHVAAVVVVHLYGQPADMEAILALTTPRGIPVVEDCSQAHGARIDQAHVGLFGDAGVFSCYPTKNLGAMGDAGIIIGSSHLCNEIRELRQYGWRTRYISEVVGRNSRMDPLQAAVLRAKLPLLPGYLERRIAIAATFSSALGDLVRVPTPGPGVTHAFHQYTIQTQRRDAVIAAMTEAHVPYAILYPLPVHLQPAYLDRCTLDPQGLEVTETLRSEILCLPVHPLLHDAQVQTVIDVVAKAL